MTLTRRPIRHNIACVAIAISVTQYPMTQQNESPSAELKRTALFEEHASAGGRMVPFAGWEMPIQYTSILGGKGRALRAGIFDVSHMGRLEITGADSPQFFHRLVTADVVNMPLGRARYTLVCNKQGGIIDDTILYRMGEERFIFIVNASNADTVLDWLRRWREEWAMDVDINVRTQETALIALQGPLAQSILQPMCSVDPSSIRPFRAVEGQVSGFAAVVCRTGYTGEDGFEVIVSAENAPSLWRSFADGGATPCGLGARDVLRLEAGLLLHGSDMDATLTPLEAGLERFVSWDKGDFTGLTALQAIANRGLTRTLVGFRLIEKGIPRHGYAMLSGEDTIGEVTSGTHSPTLDIGIGLGYVSLEHSNPGTGIAIDIRGRRTEAEVVAIPFYTRKR